MIKYIKSRDRPNTCNCNDPTSSKMATLCVHSKGKLSGLQKAANTQIGVRPPLNKKSFPVDGPSANWNFFFHVFFVVIVFPQSKHSIYPSQ